MKLPHLAIEYREEQTNTIGKISPWLVFGFGFCFAWIFLILFKSNFLMPYVDTNTRFLLFTCFFLTLAFVLLCYGFFLKTLRKLFRDASARTHRRLAATILLTLASAAINFGYLFPVHYTAIASITGVLAGIGIAVLLMSFAVSFSVTDITETAICTAGALLFTALCVATISVCLSLNYLAGCACFILLPAVQFLCLQKCSRDIVDKLNFLKFTIPVHGFSFFIHVLLPDLAFGIALGVLQFKINTYLSQYEDAEFLFLMTGVFASILLSLSTLTQHQTINFAFRTQIPIVGLLLIFLFIPDISASSYALFILFSCLLILTGCLWIMFADLAQTFRISIFTVFGFGWGLFTLSSFLSYLFIQSFSFDTSLLNDLGFYTTIILISCLFGSSFLPTSVEIRQTLKQDKGCLFLVDPDTFIKNDFVNMQKYESAAPKKPSAAHPGEKQQADETIIKTDPGNTGAVTEKNHTNPYYRQKISQLANQYLLSRKETEVLYLLGKGKKSASIQKELYISAGTANTHMRHIYRKLNVHSQQELMELVESIWIED